jgi:hypothetical protein
MICVQLILPCAFDYEHTSYNGTKIILAYLCLIGLRSPFCLCMYGEMHLFASDII